jgi:hypothetical protein
MCYGRTSCASALQQRCVVRRQRNRLVCLAHNNNPTRSGWRAALRIQTHVESLHMTSTVLPWIWSGPSATTPRLAGLAASWRLAASG